MIAVQSLGSRKRRHWLRLIMGPSVMAVMPHPVAAYDYFSGSYMGLSAGYQQSQAVYDFKVGEFVTLAATGTTPTVYLNGTGSWGSSGIVGHASLGYGAAIGVVYAGVEATYGHSFMPSGTGLQLENVTMGPLLGTDTQTTDVTTTLAIKPGSQMMAGLRFGYLTTEKSMVFLTLGLARSQYSLTKLDTLKVGGTAGAGTGTTASNYTTTGGTAQTTTDCTTGTYCAGLNLTTATTKGSAMSIVVGAGAQVFISKSVAVNLRYEYDMGKKISNIMNIIPKSTTVRIGLSYNF